MKLHEITSVNLQHGQTQLDEGLRQTLAAVLLAALSSVAQGQPLEDTVQKMSPETKAAVAKSMSAATTDGQFNQLIQAQATKASPKVQQAVQNSAYLKKFGQELQALAADAEQMAGNVKMDTRSGMARQGQAVTDMATDPDKMMTPRFR